MSHPQRGRPLSRSHSRARHRIVLFSFLGVLALLLGHHVAAVFALLAVVLGVYSLRRAKARCADAGYSSMIADWLFLGCAVALSGGTGSWLLVGAPLLAAGQLAGAAPRERAYFMAPAALLLIVTAIADPSLGGNRLLGLLELVALCVGGWVAAGRLHLRPARRRRLPAAGSVGGLGSAKALRATLEREFAGFRTASGSVSVISLRLEREGRAAALFGAQKKTRLLCEMASLVRRFLPSHGSVFCGAADEFVLVLPGYSLGEATVLAHELAATAEAALLARAARARCRLRAGAACSLEVADGTALLKLARRRVSTGLTARSVMPEEIAQIAVNQ